MNRPATEIVRDIYRHLIEMDHQWCELTTLGLELNRSTQEHAAAALPDVDSIVKFRNLHAQFLRRSHGSAEIAQSAFSLNFKLSNKSGV